MKKDKEWAKEQLEYCIKAVGNPFNDRTQAMIDAYKNVEHIINQLDEPEKIVIEALKEECNEYHPEYEHGIRTGFERAIEMVEELYSNEEENK